MEVPMQKVVHYKSSSRKIAQMLGLSFSGALIFAVLVALRHMLDTPQQLDSCLPGESNLYKWKYGYIFYKVLGAPEAPPLLLVHTPELAASAYEMRKLIEPLAQHYRVYVPDLLGFGLSDRPAINYTAETYMDLCQDFLINVVKHPATIVASRISCNYAVAIAATSPHLCERLVLISPAALAGEQVKGNRLPVRTAAVPLINAWAALLQTAPMKWLLYAILSTRFALRHALARHHALISDADLNYFYATTHQFGAQHAFMALLAGNLVQDGSQRLETLQQPILVIWGARGLNSARHIGNEQDTSWIKEHTRLVLLPDAGLAVHEEHPETVIATIREWSEEGKAAAAPKIKSSLEAYCIKCKKKRVMLNTTEVTMKNGRTALRGTCEACGTGLYRMGRAEKGAASV
jgi:pimeloyl-ACP methyl ester carboxylesterase